MTESRGSEAERVVERDLQALRFETDRDLPTLQDTARRLVDQVSSRAPRPTREGWIMKSVRFLSARPWTATAVATVAVLAVLLVVPFSYERTTGHEVRLALANPAFDAQSLAKVAGEFETALDAKEVRVTRMGEPGAETAALVAKVPSRSRDSVQRTATAFANALASRGIGAEVFVAPVKVRVSSNVYAMAVDRAIELRVDRAGKSPQEIEADVRAQLEAAGIQNPQVQVTQEDGQTKIQIQTQSSNPEGCERQFDVKLIGGGDQPLDAQLHRFECQRKPGMTDADVKADIERQMREAGVEGEVTVENGQVRIQVKKRQ